MSLSGTRRTRREFLKTTAAAVAAPYVLTSTAVGAAGRPPASSRLAMASVGIGGQGSGDLSSALSFSEVQVVAACDVDKAMRDRAKAKVDQKYGNTDCADVNDFREVVTRPDIDIILCATPDHWHALISIEAMKHGKDVYCEKPETLTVREGRQMVEIARRYGRVFSGGSQRVWNDYNWFHRMVRGGAIGDLKEVWVNVGGPSEEIALPAQPVQKGLDWDLWLGPAPWRPYNKALHPYSWRPHRDFSGGQMTNWGAHGFGGALFASNLHETGPVEIIPPDGKDHMQLTYVFANGVRLYHGGGWGGMLSFKGTKGEIPSRDKAPRGKAKAAAPNIDIPNYKGKGGIFGDFLHCVRTRERPFRDIEIAHRTATVCHLGNIAYWLGRPLKWDPVKELFVGDEEANRWLDRPKREPWRI
jgi:hypothetical protein